LVAKRESEYPGLETAVRALVTNGNAVGRLRTLSKKWNVRPVLPTTFILRLEQNIPRY